MSAQPSVGQVFLVGAGPGDPGLLTVRGATLLEHADAVVYDALANPRLLGYCPQTCEKIYVGKLASKHSMTQDQINQLLVDLAKQGKKVVRLKGGDPFVFGRGGEECQVLADHGILFEVVPGITAALAAPAYAGIPVTHRDLNSSFTFVTGHEKEEDYKAPEALLRDKAIGSSDVDWGALARLPALAFYMGVKALPRISAKLIEHGMDPSTPAAIIERGTTPRQRTVVGTLATLPERALDAQIKPPAMTVVGTIVTLRDSVNWFENRPLYGQTIVVTRTREQASDLTHKLEALGAQVLEAPTIELTTPTDPRAIDDALRAAGTYDWVVFTSAAGVRFTKQRLIDLQLDVRVFGNAKVAAIGDATSRAVRDELALRVDVSPVRFVAEALSDALHATDAVRGRRFLLLRADIARPLLRERLLAGGATDVCDVPIYETKIVEALPPNVVEAIDSKQVNWVTFTSGSTVRNFVQLLGSQYKQKLTGVRLASIGPITTQVLSEAGLEPTVQADVFDLNGLVNAIIKS